MNVTALILFLLLTACQNDRPEAGQTLPDGTVMDHPLINAPESLPEAPSERSWTEEFMNLINAHRTARGLRSLIHQQELGEIAWKHSQNMAQASVAFGHSGFSERCTESRKALGGGNWCAENVANGQRSPEAVFNSWMNSPGHRSNIEQERATHTGFGYAKSLSGKYYWTQIFLEH